MAEIKYKRLTRARARSLFAIAFMSRSSLWLGDDHLLCVESAGYSETYKRFYFRDIQAVTIQQTMRYQWLNGIAAFIFLSFFALSLATLPKTSPSLWSSGEIAGGIVLAVVLGLCVLLLLANLFCGATCKTGVRTAVQTEELPSLCRVRRARKVLQNIRPLIAAAQGGQLSPDVASAWMQNLAASAGAPAQNTAADKPNVPPRLVS